MQFIKEFSEFEPWSGAVDTFEKIRNVDKLDELEAFLEEQFMDEIPSDGEINDLLWFDGDWVLSCLGLLEEEEPDLPTEVDCTLDDLLIALDEEDVDEAINECGCDYLADQYGYCVKTMSYTLDFDKVHFYDIEWDTEG